MANPIYISSQRNDIVDAKIQDMLYGFSMPPANYINHGDTDMRTFYNEKGDQAYDRFLSLSSTIELNGRNLRSALKGLFKSNQFKVVEKNYLAGRKAGLTGTEDPRVSLTKRVISRYRRAAKREVLSEFPDLQQLIGNFKNQQRQLRNPIPTL
jgi:hypothetical protein